MFVAYFVEAMLVAYMPADLISDYFGQDTFFSIFTASIFGGFAYLNGFAAVPLVSGFIQQGMGAGSAMAFLIAGGVSCMPAAIAVWALVKPKVFSAYIGFAFVGSVLVGFAWSSLTSLL